MSDRLLARGFEGLNIFDVSKFKAKAGAVSSSLMGFVFALAFCPISAALYFGVIIPLAAKSRAPFSLPLLYGVGTALPVVGLAVALDLGLKKISCITGLGAGFLKYAKPATGWTFIACGVYLGLKYIFGII